MARWRGTLCAALLLAWPIPAAGDVVYPELKLCPLGHVLSHGHGRSYCRPPQPGNCKPGEIPAVNRSRAFCDAPPEKPCPTGARWRPTYMAGLDSCIAGARCRPPGGADAGPSAAAGGHVRDRCAQGETCRRASLCVRDTFMGRGPAFSMVSGTCKTDADCKGAGLGADLANPFAQKGGRCVRAWRCDPDRKRGPDDRTDPSTYLREHSTTEDLPGLLITPAVILAGLYLLGLIVTVAMIIRDRRRRRRS